MWQVKQLPEATVITSSGDDRVAAYLTDLVYCFGEPTHNYTTTSDGDSEVEFSWKMKFSKDGEPDVYACVWGVFNKHPIHLKSWTVNGDPIASSLIKQFLDGVQ